MIKFAYVICVDKYLRIEEMPSGRGIADVVFISKKKSPLPAMIIKLKWNNTEEAAIRQIKEKNYPATLGDYGDKIVLVGLLVKRISLFLHQHYMSLLKEPLIHHLVVH